MKGGDIMLEELAGYDIWKTTPPENKAEVVEECYECGEKLYECEECYFVNNEYYCEDCIKSSKVILDTADMYRGDI